MTGVECFMDYNRLEIQLLKYWQQQGIKEIYKYKSMIKWKRRDGLVNFMLIEDIAVNKLFLDLLDLASLERDTTVDDVKNTVDELLAVRVGNEKVVYQPEILQKDLLKYWSINKVENISKYKHSVREVYDDETHTLFLDVTSGLLFQMVQDIASLPRDSELTFQELKVSVSKLLEEDISAFEITLPPVTEVVVTVVFQDQRTEEVIVQGSDKQKALQHVINTWPKSKLDTVALIKAE